MRARIYAPTLQQRRVALKVADRFRPTWLVKLGVYATVAVSYAWYKSGFAFPFEFNAIDLAFALLVATVIEIWQFATKTDKAKLHHWLQEEECRDFGPLHYRLTEAGFEWWQ